MSKVKKVFAIILSMAMILGMSLTAFAAETAKIVVNNLEEGTSVKAVQVIEPSTTSDTGWGFVSNEIAKAYTDAFEITDSEDAEDIPNSDEQQKAIWMLLLAENEDLEDQLADKNINIPEGVTEASDAQIKSALAAIDYTNAVNPDEKTTNEFTVNKAGVYAIKATATESSSTIYNPMAAYVGFTYNEDGTATLPEKAVNVYAKKTDVPVEKSAVDDDNATGISETVTYKVETAVPYGVSQWKFTDTLTGAIYAVVPEGTTDEELKEHIGELPVEVKIGTTTTTEYATVTGNSFELDLTSYVTNENYGAEVEFTYDVVVTGTEVSNEIQYDDKHESDEVKLYTGSIIFTKYDEGTNKLGGAGFKVSRIVEEKTEYAVFTTTEDGTYQLKEWVDSIGAATEVFTNNDKESDTYGTLKITGLDKDTYHFTETTAPEGYTINDNGKNVTFESGIVTAAFSTTGSMNDTKLSSLPLPSTGGMGTTIFTIGGCVIMIAAAGLYFASRRKESK